MLPSEGFIATARYDDDSVFFTINTISMRHVDDRHGLDMFCTEATSTNIVLLHCTEQCTNDAIQNIYNGKSVTVYKTATKYNTHMQTFEFFMNTQRWHFCTVFNVKKNLNKINISYKYKL